MKFKVISFILAGLFISTLSVAQHPVETERMYLSGKGPGDAVEWDFFCTAGRKSGEWTKIKVPSCWEQEGFGEYLTT